MEWLHIPAAFMISILSGMGVGGGGLFVIYLSFMTDMPQLMAQGSNLLFFLFCAGAAILVHLQKRVILWKAVGILTLFGIVGVLLGTSLSAHMDESLLRKIFGILLVISGILSLKQSFVTPNKTTEVKENHHM